MSSDDSIAAKDPAGTTDAGKSSPSSPSFLWAELRSEALALIGGSLAMIGSSMANQMVPRLMGRLIDRTESTSSSSAHDNRLLTMVIVGGGLASLTRTILLGTAESRIKCRLRREAVDALLNMDDLEWFQTESASTNSDDDTTTTSKGISSPKINGSKQKPEKATSDNDTTAAAKGFSPAAIATILDHDVDLMASTLTTTLANLLRSTSSVVFSTLQMLRLDPVLLGWSAAIVPLLGTTAMLLRKAVLRVTVQRRDVTTTAASFVEERLNNIALVKLSNRQTDEALAYTALQHRVLALDTASAIYNGAMMGFLFATSCGALLLVVSKGKQSVAAGRLSSGQLTSFATFSFLLGLGTSGVIKAGAEIATGLVAAKRYQKLLVSAATHQAEATRGGVPEKSTSDDEVNVSAEGVDGITLEKVSFQYKSGNSTILNEISLCVNRGKVVALVGKNGSGKTTLASVLAGLYAPTSGSITIVGESSTDLTHTSRASRQKVVQMLPQRTALFNASVFENVRYSNPSATREQVWEALAQADGADFVSKLPDGMDYVVGLDGVQLSGGQRQKIALARALLSDPAVLILDEPYNSLDAQGESALGENVLRACRSTENGRKPRALLLITHSPRSLQLADLVVVLGDGQIAEQGTYQELASNPQSELCRLMPEAHRSSKVEN